MYKFLLPVTKMGVQNFLKIQGVQICISRCTIILIIFFSTGKESCSGDSGGPLFYRESQFSKPYYQIGIVSFGLSQFCGKNKYPGFYTKVEAFLPWIESKLMA